MWRLFRFNDQKSGSWQPSSIDTLSDEEIYALIDGIRDEDIIGSRNEDLKDFYRGSIVHRISHDAVVKYGYEFESFTMSYVASRTSIPIPPVRRVLPPRPAGHEFEQWIVMDLIEGETLETAWPTLSWWSRLRVIWYIRRYMRQLHSIPIPYPDQPGPFDVSGKPHECGGLFFTLSGGGPFTSYAEMADWYDRRRFDALVHSFHSNRCGALMQCPKFDRSQPLAVCHMDLHTGNIIIDRNGIPWIIDWGEAGAYPIWFDYVKAAYFTTPWTLWNRSMTFMFGDYRKYLEEYLLRMQVVWDDHVMDFPLDYFSKRGMKVD